MSQLNRRNFIQGMSALGTGLAVAGPTATTPAAEPAENKFVSAWSQLHDRVWIGPEHWANPLQDWRIANGRLECVNAAGNRNVQLLTHSLSQKPGTLTLRVTVGRLDKSSVAKGKGSVGFRIGIRGPLEDYRNAVIFGSGLDAGLSGGTLFVGRKTSNPVAALQDRESLQLRLTAEPRGEAYQVTLAAHDPESGELLAEVSLHPVAADRLRGNVALVNNHAVAGRRRGRQNGGGVQGGLGSFWFADWQVAGTKVEEHKDRTFGPILFSQYTLSGGVMKLTAQMPPIGPNDSQTVRLQIQQNDKWIMIGNEPIHPEARTATFRIADWNDTLDVPYRLVYTQNHRDEAARDFFWTGTIRRDPVDQPVITVGDISCNVHAAFPNAHYVENVAKLNPDLLAFTGDQFYESTGGYGVQRTPLDKAILDYLRKWWLHGWTWRELTRDRPSLSLPDDHDVYQGNVWGAAGGPKQETQAMGGYDMHPAWVNVVHRTQTSHHPDAHDPTPIQQNVSVYYGAMTYGRISFAVLADRMFKSGPEGKVPPTPGRGDHVTDPNFDPKTADVPGIELLGQRQIAFLKAWATDWQGAEIKAVISQTIFTAMATTHGGGRERLVADYDANGWPQTARNEALIEMRKAFAVHLAGDQHLPAVVHYGVEEHRDAAVAFAGPAVNVGYPRWWEPTKPGENRQPNSPEITGDFLDHFGNKLTVLAVKNGEEKPPQPVLEAMQAKASGLGIVRFDKPNRKITMECWPFLADPTQPDSQFPGWPVVVNVLDNGRQAAAYLPTIKLRGLTDAVVQVINDKTQAVEYTLRIKGDSFRPMVFDPEATHTVKVGQDKPQDVKELSRLKPDSKAVIEVTI